MVRAARAAPKMTKTNESSKGGVNELGHQKQKKKVAENHLRPELRDDGH